MGDAAQLVREHLINPDSGWSMGTRGGLAEFVWAPDEPISTSAGEFDTEATNTEATNTEATNTEANGLGQLVTDRGGIRLTLPESAIALAYETPAGPHLHWNHAVALCLPTDQARRAARDGITELGADTDSLRELDRTGVLFDLGLGIPSVDVCVRTSDPSLLRLLRSALGQRLFDSAIVGDLVAASPHRVLCTEVGRIEVYATIPPAEGRSPDGPHTHLLPHLLRENRTHPPTVPIPSGHTPVAHLYPPSPLQDNAGRPIPFDHRRFEAFQHILRTFGDRDLVAWKDTVLDAVRADRSPDEVPAPTSPSGRAVEAVALRQLAHLTGDNRALATWRGRRAVPSALLDPEGDPNA
jgi:hypothetical protein